MYGQHETPQGNGVPGDQPEGTPVYDSAGDRVGTFFDTEPNGQGLLVRRGHLFGHLFSLPRATIAWADASGIYLNVRRETLKGLEQADMASPSGKLHTEMALAAPTTPDTPMSSAGDIHDAMGQARDSIKSAVQATGGAVQQAAGQAAQAAQQAAGNMLAAARHEAEGAKGVVHEKAAESLTQASEGLAEAAAAVGQVSEGLRRVDRGVLSQYTDRAAQQLEDLAARLRAMTPEQALREMEQVARRQPALFIAAAFAVGLLGARVLQSAGGHEDKH